MTTLYCIPQVWYMCMVWSFYFQDEIDYDTCQKMPYLEMCIEETLRMFPPGPQ